MRGPSSQDCEKSYARTGIPSENYNARHASPPSQALNLVQIQGFQPVHGNLPGKLIEGRAASA
jgi:hypothetical protein